MVRKSKKIIDKIDMGVTEEIKQSEDIQTCCKEIKQKKKKKSTKENDKRKISNPDSMGSKIMKLAKSIKEQNKDYKWIDCVSKASKQLKK